MCLDRKIGLICILPQGHCSKGVSCCSGCIWSEAPWVLGKETSLVQGRRGFPLEPTPCQQSAGEPDNMGTGFLQAWTTTAAWTYLKSPRSHSVPVRDIVYGGFQPQTKHLTTRYSAENDISRCIYWEIVKMYIILQAFNFNLHFLKLCRP